eukprot:CAMPEP_0202027776 /NCGR_PEP_ID=MMETSP0905-20130828/62333_1 /ASSEMBLY_ACC=CAM_ASM_000554 /TAXON_ID=420261 /ORGANISM="Thalassiosira antarctica, Strain CCMP982" /LENGTH=537 /DNA_ID=CAMNT_0048591373 /DNA_START=193 /DNA_END=1806 /DNA_ORIENTATION=-
MAPPRRRRRPRSTVACSTSTVACSTSTAHRRRTGMATTVAMSLLTLFHSTDAFTLPQSSAVRMPQTKSFTQIMFQTSDGGEASHDVHSSSPIRSSNQSLTRLTHRQEVSLLRQMRDHPSDTSLSQIARQTLLLHNLPLVQSIVTKILRSRPHLVARHGSVGGSPRAEGDTNGSNINNKMKKNGRESQVGAALTRDDLLHEGTIGLAEAIDRYDLTFAHDDYDDEEEEEDGESPQITSTSATIPKGARLGTYATYWIRARILRAIQSREHAIRFPEHALLSSHRLVKAAKEMELDWQYVAELADYDVISVSQKRIREELREAAGITSDSLFRDAVRVRTMSQVGAVTPLESWMSPSSSSTLNIEDEESSEAGQEHIRETLSKFLMPREVEVLSLRFGLDSSEEDENHEVIESSSDVLSSQLQSFHNYQAEAEDDLFGPEGMMSHYSATPSESIAAVATSKKMKNRVTAAASSMPISPQKTKTMAKRTKAPTLLPFKEIGSRMKFSGEYCRRTCTEALNKLTRAVEEGRLAESDFLLCW